MAASVRHPDLHWVFPRPRLKDTDPDLEDVKGDLADGIEERLREHGVYEAPGGDEGIFVATVRMIVQTASLSPAMGGGRKKVFVIGDADRMVAQEGAEYAANAFLKLLEEPPADTTIILTSSEPGALLPTIRSRVVSLRVATITDSEVREFLTNPDVAKRIAVSETQGVEELVQLAGGAPGRLIGNAPWTAALAQAKRMLDAAAGPDRGQRMRVALSQGATGARGRFSDTLEALTVVLHERSREAVRRGNSTSALGAARAAEVVEEVKELAGGNVNPQLLTASLLRRIAPLVAGAAEGSAR
jgi:DNA polymerase-3 subunit delta'